MSHATLKSDLPDTSVEGAAPASANDLLDIEAVCRFFGGSKPLHPATIYRGVGKRYPRPIRVSPNVNRWLRIECEAALRAMLETSRGSTA
jgi:predicted DNA-binding transcriptional regulator AlpA